MKNIFELGGPVCLQYLSGIFPSMMPNFFLGHVSATSLGAYSLGNMFINFSGFAVIAGFASNLDTHLSQAFGAKKVLSIPDCYASKYYNQYYDGFHCSLCLVFCARIFF
jgi:Na+-driven multidrug efflux pump